jgi:selenocysteine-specific elongation factor
VTSAANAKHFIVATAGHVDHGKSALVKALTGTDPDRLPEEKARGITIDLGFAHFQLTTAEGTTSSVLDLGIVDVPGHEDFVRNMAAGVGSVDLALFVVAADDGWMPQSEEHLQILSYLGVSRAVVALTKADLSGPRLSAVTQSVREQLQGTSFATAPIVPTSVVTGAGLEDLKAALARVLASTPLRADVGKPRLPIDRAFTVRGIGTVVTGTLIGGQLKQGQAVVLQPSGRATRVRSIQSHNCELDLVGPGRRAALGLADVPVADRHVLEDNTGVRRGQIVTLADFGRVHDTFHVYLERSLRLQGSNSPAARPLKDGTRVRVHYGSSDWAARISLRDKKELAAGESALAQLRFDTPVFAFAGDHFIVRDWAEQTTLAGGMILDPDARRRGFHSRAAATQLTETAPPLPALDVVSAIRRKLTTDRMLYLDALLLKSNFSSSEIHAGIARLKETGALVAYDTLVAEASWWNELRKTAVSAIDKHHQLHPAEDGLPLAQLRTAVRDKLTLSEGFEALLAELLRSGFAQAGSAIKRASHRAALPPELQTAGNRLRGVLSAKPLDPPSRKELAPTPPSQQALRFLVQTGEAVELGDDVVLLAAAYRKAVEAVKEQLRKTGRATVSELRQAIGASRRITVPLLEKLDREGITRRENDTRVLRN